MNEGVDVEDVQTHGLMRYQFDSYLKKYKSKVVNCVPYAPAPLKKGQKKDEKFESVTHVVELANTILFCEGGGQPADKGTINNVNVVYVGRDDSRKVQHYVTGELKIGEEVEIILDWKRREDHMQQHSAQHLISAIAENEYQWDTTSWYLGEDKCNIEFSAKNPDKPVTQENLNALEALVNKSIREARPVGVKVVLNDESESSGNPESDRKDPSRHHGALRVVVIEGIDSNQCCGTHVSSTSELQVVKILGKENARGQTRIFFIAGNRVVNLLSVMLEREAAINGILSAGADLHVQIISKLQNDSKSLAKSKKQLMIEIAEFEILKVKNILATPEVQNHKVVSLYRSDADLPFLSYIASNIAEFDPQATCLLACGDTKDGMFLISSPKCTFNLSTVGNTIAQLLKGKGGGKSPKYQGKATDLSKLNEAETILINEITKSNS